MLPYISTVALGKNIRTSLFQGAAIFKNTYFDRTFSVADSEIKVKWSLLNFRFTRNLGGRFRGLFCNGGEMGKITPLVYNSLGFCEKLEIQYASTHSYLVSEIISVSTRSFLIFLMSWFSAKNHYLFAKTVPLVKAIA